MNGERAARKPLEAQDLRLLLSGGYECYHLLGVTPNLLVTYGCLYRCA